MLFNFKKNIKIYLVLIIITILTSCSSEKKEAVLPKVALLSDVHFHDIYAKFADNKFNGMSINGEYAKIRTMQSELTSTRLFNENYFAFIASLDDIAKKGIKFVILSGDQTDDGQTVHLQGLDNILKKYETQYGMQFFMTFGNHDPNRPFDKPAGIDDWLGANGDNQAIYSKSMEGKVENKLNSSNQIIYSDDATQLGYEKLVKAWANYGFMPQEDYLYYQTPFSTYDTSNYSFEKAQEESAYEKRTYQLNNQAIFDGSYVVEPVKGLWILSIDNNVYIPNGDGFTGSGDNGYPTMKQYKPHTLEWIAKVSTAAKEQNKKLIVFGHLPASEFFDGTIESIETIFGKGKMQAKRSPDLKSSLMLRELGIQVIFSGHMHINDTSKIIDENTNNSLINIQIPSLSAYLPAYKIVNFIGDKMNISTIEINEVKDFNKLFPYYEKEHAFLTSKGLSTDQLWNKEILKAKTYREFTDWHMKELIRLRFMKNEWPADMLSILNGKTLYDVAMLSNNTNIKVGNLKNITTTEMIVDFHRLLNGDVLALSDVGSKKLEAYAYLHELFKPFQFISANNTSDVIMQNKLYNLFNVLQSQTKDIPFKDISIDLTNNIISELK